MIERNAHYCKPIYIDNFKKLLMRNDKALLHTDSLNFNITKEKKTQEKVQHFIAVINSLAEGHRMDTQINKAVWMLKRSNSLSEEL